MSGASKKLMGTTAAGGAEFLAVEEVFQSWLYTGNGSTQTITNGIDLAGEGGLVWTKSRSSTWNNTLIDTENGGDLYLYSNTTVGHTLPSPVYITSFNSDGYTISTANELNSTLFSTNNYASWTFRKAPRFFDVVTYTGNGGSQTIAHNLGVTPGMIIVKRTDSNGDWAVAARVNDTQYTVGDGGSPLSLNTTNGGGIFYEFAPYMNDTTFSTAAFWAGSNLDTSGATYVAYLFAHDPLGPSGDGSDGLIACGSYTGNGSTDGPEINLGWEPQWVMVKNASTSVGNWNIADVMRGMPVGSNTQLLAANNSDAEGGIPVFVPQPTGFKVVNNNEFSNGSGNTYIYIAIRRGPMRQPTSGTEVFAIDTLGGTAPNPPGFDAGFPVDLGFYKTTASSNNWIWADRLRGEKELYSNLTNAEASNTDIKFDYQSGWLNSTGVVSTLYSWMFRRAPGFFDVVAFQDTSGTAFTIDHNLGVQPELIIFKRRDSSEDWWTYPKSLSSSYVNFLILNGAGPAGVSSGITGATESTVSVSSFFTNKSYVMYLFATLPGVSKVGSYTGNGTSQTIDCGFTSGARFVLIKRTTSPGGDWYLWDTVNGIVTGNDPHLSLNTDAAEVTTDDSIDPASTGFIVNQVAATNINVSSASYIFMAIS